MNITNIGSNSKLYKPCYFSAKPQTFAPKPIDNSPETITNERPHKKIYEIPESKLLGAATVATVFTLSGVVLLTKNTKLLKKLKIKTKF